MMGPIVHVPALPARLAVSPRASAVPLHAARKVKAARIAGIALFPIRWAQVIGAFYSVRLCRKLNEPSAIGFRREPGRANRRTLSKTAPDRSSIGLPFVTEAPCANIPVRRPVRS
jgi:hypothetical protein